MAKRRKCDICGGSHIKTSRRKCIKHTLLKTLKEAMDLRDGNCCQKCGDLCYGKHSHMSHVFRVSSCGRLKFELDNVKTLCSTCHQGWWHNNEAAGGVWFAKTWPQRWKHIEAKRLEYRLDPGTITMEWYLDQLELLRANVRRLQSERENAS